MATYRQNATPSTFDEKPILSPSQGGIPPTASDTSPAVPSDVIYKLLGFTFAMIFFPIGSYFFTVNTVFRGKLCPILASISCSAWTWLSDLLAFPSFSLDPLSFRYMQLARGKNLRCMFD